MVRNLICHIFPFSPGQQWRCTVRELLARWDVFTGKKIVAIATNRCTDPVARVVDSFGCRASEIEFLEFRNDPHLREVQTFVPMLERIESTKPGEITFSCHAKGSTRPHDNAMSHPWRDLMFRVCLDDPRLAECVLKEKNICGAFRLFGRDNVDWIFAGSFYWFRNDAVFTRDWRNVPRIWTGTENWPCTMFQREESQCLFLDNCQTPYDENYWAQTVFPSFHFWRENLRHLGLSMRDYSPPNWFLRQHPNFHLPIGTVGSVTIRQERKNWLPIEKFRKHAAALLTR